MQKDEVARRIPTVRFYLFACVTGTILSPPISTIQAQFYNLV